VEDHQQSGQKLQETDRSLSRGRLVEDRPSRRSAPGCGFGRRKTGRFRAAIRGRRMERCVGGAIGTVASLAKRLLPAGREDLLRSTCGCRRRAKRVRYFIMEP
jgi:hypothetical protein